MATQALTADTVDDVVLGHDLVLVDFWAAWCGPCRQYGHVYSAVAQKHPDILFTTVNTDEHPAVAERFGIASVPTTIAFRSGRVVHVEVGPMMMAGLERVIAKLRAAPTAAGAAGVQG